MQMVRLYLFQNYIKEEKSGLIRQCDEREKVCEEIKKMCQEKNTFEKRPRKVLLLAKSPKFYSKVDLQKIFLLTSR